jgi:hypothetical protein
MLFPAFRVEKEMTIDLLDAAAFRRLDISPQRP